MSEDDKNKIFDMITELTRAATDMSLAVMNGYNKISTKEALNVTHSFISGKISEINTKQRRNKKTAENRFYVKPEEMAIGCRWETKRIKKGNRKILIRQRVQSTFQYVSLLETLQALFRNAEFCDLYLYTIQ